MRKTIRDLVGGLVFLDVVFLTGRGAEPENGSETWKHHDEMSMDKDPSLRNIIIPPKQGKFQTKIAVFLKSARC